MSLAHKAGSSDPVQTSTAFSLADADTAVVTIEGIVSDLKDIDPADFAPSGYYVDRVNLNPSGNGLGKLVLNCKAFDSGSASSFSPIRTTFRVSMVATTYDLIDHPYIGPQPARDLFAKWLATDETDRMGTSTTGEGATATTTSTPQYIDSEGNAVPITDAKALLAINAYRAGIKTFVRYFPVITKRSFYKNPPGLTQVGRSFSGGSMQFSSYIGRYNAPPITLGGYSSINWFKSGDEWNQNSDTTWVRDEEWTYTPETNSSPHAWIYNTL